MDAQSVLKEVLKKKYQKLKKAFIEKSLLPPRLCYQELDHDDPCNKFCRDDFRYVDKSELHSWILFQSVPLAEILSCDCRHTSAKRVIMTFGVCGVGKTTAVQSCALDWAEGKGYDNIGLLFPLTFWELKLLKKKLSLIEVLQTFYPELKMLNAVTLNKKNVWFVLDGLDDFQLWSPVVKDVFEASTVDALIANLINGNLLPRAHIWITARNSARKIIPRNFLLKETEVQGFSNEQKEQLFRTVIGNDDLAYKAINHVRISRSLYFLCEIPPVCTIAATVLKEHVKPDDGFKINPLNLTQIYARLVTMVNPSSIVKLKRLASYGKKPNFFTEQCLSHFKINLEEASAISRECPLLLREVKGLHNTTVFCFGHSSIYEFLAASASLDNMVSLSPDLTRPCCNLVDLAVKSSKGERYVFTRFLFGILKERDLMPPTDPLFAHTKSKILENILNDTGVELFHCLREYDRQALLPEVWLFSKLGICPPPTFTPMHWHFMVQRSTNFEGMRIQFSMEVSKSCDETLIRQITAILKSRKAILRLSNLTDRCCPALVAVLSYKESYLRELDLGYNSISDVGVMSLVEGLSDDNCKLKILRLQCCKLTSRACTYLATALSKSRKLTGLDLSSNKIGDEGLRLLAGGLASQDCQLEELRLSQCSIEEGGCKHLASALHKNPDHLKMLDLSINMVRDKGACVLFEKFNISKLTKLEMHHCGLTFLSCIGIGEALKYESSTLVELNLSNNYLEDTGLTLLSEGMYAWCSLEKLNVSGCGITSAGCSYFSKVLSSVSQLFSEGTIKTEWQAVELIELDLSMNSLGDKGVKEISVGLECNPYSHLKTLNLSYCGLTHKCCAELAKALASEKSIITDLDLSDNNIQDEGMKKLCVGFRNPYCTIETLFLKSCGLSRRSVQSLVTALRSNPKHLVELHLMGNKLEESDLSPLVELTQKHPYKLQIIDFTAIIAAAKPTFPLPPYFCES